MRVCYVVPQNLALVNGGVKTQGLQTIEAVKKHGVEPVLLQPWQSLNEHEIDLVHIFHAGAETYELARKFNELSKPILLSPVFFTRHKASTIQRSRKLEAITGRWFKGIRTDYSIKASVCHYSDHIAPNTQAEAELIQNGLGISADKISVVPNGVEKRFADASPDKFREMYGDRECILFAGQAGAPRKGLITLLEAAKELQADLFVIGDLYDDAYGQTCRTYFEKYPHYHQLPNLPHDSELLASAYAACKVFVLPSLYETPGIAAMEAAITGAEIVITENGGTKEYFGDLAEYITPYSVSSVREALKKGLKKQTKSELKEHILKRYTWDSVGEQTFELYQKLIGPY
jgi:glycosyltransferase involved in cell wall biosynthesis